nr:hypothetical protein [uncultured Butyrivibrio sp.]
MIKSIESYEDFVKVIQGMNEQRQYYGGGKSKEYQEVLQDFLARDYVSYKKYTKRIEKEFLKLVKGKQPDED